ncbi:MAG: hypothetical protein LBH17_05780 [Oscillospiraceae bacterium]|jgi:hypothetical protein|nr:hypothetical protein [Oscillospiraceae bacterium]
MEKNNRPRPMGLNIGSASIIMLFTVLCLTVLAALSLLSANSQYRLAERSAAAAEAYYAADAEAAAIYERLKNGEYNGDVIITTETAADGGTLFSYEIPAGGRQALSVRLTRDSGGGFYITEWRLVESGEWTPDEGLNLWQGPDE